VRVIQIACRFFVSFCSWVQIGVDVVVAVGLVSEGGGLWLVKIMSPLSRF
jgi:hypothetical protein